MVTIIQTILDLFLFFLLVRVVLSYLPIPPGSGLSSVARVFEAVTEPVLRPIRRVVPPLRMGSGAVDLSPIIVWIVILIVSRLI